MKKTTPIFIVTLIGLIITVPITLIHLVNNDSKVDFLYIGIFGSISVILVTVLIIERLFIYILDIKNTGSSVITDDNNSLIEKKSFYSKNKKFIFVFQIVLIVAILLPYYIAFHQPKFKLTVRKNVKCYGVYEGTKSEKTNAFIKYISGNSYEIVDDNAKIIFDNKDEIRREVESELNFEHSVIMDQYQTFKVIDTIIGLRIYTIDGYQLTQQDSIKIINQLIKIKK